MAHVVGKVLGLHGDGAAGLCGIEPASLHTRRQRAGARIPTFMKRRYGLPDPADRCRCRCRRRDGAASRIGRRDRPPTLVDAVLRAFG